MSANRNENGYDITAQNYFDELGSHSDSELDPITHQSVSEARAKLKWEAFEYLLGRANREKDFNDEQFTYRGHITRAVDGTSMITPRTEDLLSHFTPRISTKGEGHYPSLLLVTAINVFTGQVISGKVENHTASERDQLRFMIRHVFNKGDLSLLDRGFPAGWIFLEYKKAEQFYLARLKTTGDRMSVYVRQFLKSKQKSKVITITVMDETTGREVEIKIRLVRGPKDSEGKRIAFATNLIGEKYSRRSILKLYRERWTVETLYWRVKILLKIERFHSRSYNGVMQEIFANLLVLSLTALIWAATIKKHRLNAKYVVPSFKNAVEVVRRHLFHAIDNKITGTKARVLAKKLILQTGRVLWAKQPGRSYPRVSMQPIKSWNLAKIKKLEEFKNRRT